MRIGFYISLNGNVNRDITVVDNGNPGFGGTEFCFSLLISHLAKFEDISITVYSDTPLIIPNDCIFRLSTNNDLFDLAIKDEVELLILKAPTFLECYETIQQYPSLNIICWAHNYLNSHVTKAISLCQNIKSVVFVSKQMYDFYYDDDIIRKSTFIYNPVPDVDCPKDRKYIPLSVVYMGSLIPDKGIISVLEIWKRIEKKYPNAKLTIIGAGNIYNPSIQLGKNGITYQSFEDKILKYLLDKNGKRSNIEFIGVLGTEKYRVFQEAAVGIVNPTAKTETFGMGIIEMASMKLPVVTKAWNGHLDTVVHKKTGLLAFSKKGIARNIIRLFEDNLLNNYLGENAKVLVEKYNPDCIALIWHDLLLQIKDEQFHHVQLPMSYPLWNNFKIIRKVNYYIRVKFKLSFFPSIVEIETIINDIIKLLKKVSKFA